MVVYNRGFSMVELLLVLAVIGILSSIAIPSYNRYKTKAAVVSYRSDLSDFYSALQAFGLEGNFCESSGQDFSLENVGLEKLKNTQKYQVTSTTDNPDKTEGTPPTITQAKPGSAGSQGFIGFGTETCENINALVAEEHYLSAGSSIKDSHCTLDENSFKVGVSGALAGEKVGAWSVDDQGVFTDVSPSETVTHDSACS